MKTRLLSLACLALLATLNSQLSPALAQGSGFTYQGRLNDGVGSANGVYDLRFAMYDAASNGTQVGPMITNTATAITNGLFTVSLDFGGVFNGGARWLELAVRTNGAGGAFVTLSPRQALTAAPYALYAMTPAGPMGPEGPQGPAGAAGATGPQGPVGATGAQGIAGPTGPQGPVGAMGPQGPVGATGLQGLIGPAGPIGPTGATGAIGPEGPAGAAGPAGPQGPVGVNWRGAWTAVASYVSNDAVAYNGTSWLAKQANSNVPPAEGANWTTLAQKGDTGTTGPQGPIGATGPQGTVGATGLQGPVGATGAQGLTGPAGPIGPAGATGAIGPEGPAGAAGPTGPQGPVGVNWRGAWTAVASYVSNDAVAYNGTSWLAKQANSNVAPAEGVNWTLLAQKGDTGTTGPQGPIGATGPQGAIGATGPQGPVGATGPQGLTGPAGPIGPAGATGAIGPEGPAGAVGPMGPQGPVGVNWRGAWTAVTSYVSNDAVAYNGTSWLAKQANSNVAPAEGANWTMLAQKGDTGGAGPQGAVGPQGPTGATGLQGPIGATGPQGPMGVTGPQGPQGLPGSADAWARLGNAGTDPSVNFIGTTDLQPLELRVNGTRALRLEPVAGTVNVVGGFSGNSIINAVGATIAGGGTNTLANAVMGNFSVVGGGAGNVVGTNSEYSAIAGGVRNQILGQAGSGTSYGFIGGGLLNQIGTNAGASVVGGGAYNSILTNAMYATIPGGSSNMAGGLNSFAGGHRAQALHSGSFVWGDNTEADVSSTAANQLILRATGGVGIGTTTPASALDVNGTVTATGFSGNGAGLTNLNAASVSGTFTGNVVGSASSAGSFSGLLAGDVTGTQGATVVSSVGGQSAANIASGASAANAATSLATASTIVKRDPNGDFSAGSVTLGGNLNLPLTTAGAGIIYSGGLPWLHNYGLQNFFAGSGAGNLTMSGINNVGVGVEALNQLTTGNYNTANGAFALYSSTNGNANTANGTFALYSSTNGNANTANGYGALTYNTIASRNTANGANALFYSTIGSNNTALGYSAGLYLTTGSHNTALGYQAGLNLTTGNDNIDIGHLGFGSDTGIIRIGTPGTHLTTYIAGSVQALTNLSVKGSLNVFNETRINQQELYLRGNNGDRNHGLGWYGAGKPFGSLSVDGPALYGYSGGVLGTMDSGYTTNVALYWNNSGKVGIGTTTPASALDVAGTVTANSFVGNGSGLTGLNVGSLAGGTVNSTLNFSPASGPPFTVGNSTVVPSLNADLLDGLHAGGFWQAGGNAGTTPGVDFLGTTDNQPLELKVNNSRALRLEPTSSGAPNVIGGSPWNYVAAGTYGATIAGGGAMNESGVAETNSISGVFSTIGGGTINSIVGVQCTIAGGARNTNSGYYCAIGGGTGNAVISGSNGGTIPGGVRNLVTGNYGFAAGQNAQSLHNGSFVWADSSPGNFASTGPDQFCIRANGGVGIGAAPGDALLDVQGNVRLNDNDIFLRAAGDRNHGLGWYGAGKPFGSLSLDGPALYGYSGGVLGTTEYTTNVALYWNSSGNVGIGITAPNAKLDVLGDARVRGSLRLGSETNTFSGPSYPPTSKGLVIRRVASLSSSAGALVACTDFMRLERDGSTAGLRITLLATSLRLNMVATGVDRAGTVVAPFKAVWQAPAASTTAVFTDAQKVVHYDISFGNAYSNGHTCHVVLDRYDDYTTSDNYLIGTMTTTYDQ